MIRNEAEYEHSVKQLREQAERMRQQEAELAAMDLSHEEIKRAMDPVRSFHKQLEEEVESYERLKRGEFEELRNFGGLGRLLVALRVAQGLSQRELAERLVVPGRVIAPRFSEAVVPPPVSGRVLPPPGGSLPLVGQKVRRGDVLVEIEPSVAGSDAVQMVANRAQHYPN